MLDLKPIKLKTEDEFLEQKIWNALCNANCSHPVSLKKADLSKSFVYDRTYGIFYVPYGYHKNAMSYLLAFNLGFYDLNPVYELFNKKDSSSLSSIYLENVPGTGFKSSLSSVLECWNEQSLSVIEKRIFVNYRCITTTVNDKFDFF